MKLRDCVVIAISGLVMCGSAAGNVNSCPPQVLVKKNSTSSITVDSGKPIHYLSPEFFGFNLEWVEFQESLWDKSSGRVRSDIANWLRPFSGAVYRYPGGTISNEMDWRDTVGESGKRPSRKYVDWADPFPAQFGLDEYLNFVKDVNGRAWYAVNIHGHSKGELPLSELAASTGQLSKYLVQKKQEGLPDIFRWELGNELDRSGYRWLPEKLASTAKIIAAEIVKADPGAKTVSLLQEYAAQWDAGISASQYNQRLVAGLPEYSNDYAMHVYYDGKPGGQPVPSAVRAICGAIADAKSAMPKHNTPSIWLTEHARVPPNAWVDPNWKSSWSRTGDLEAAIGVADMIIAAAQIPEVRGTFIHTLHGTGGPWPLFHKEKNGGMHPSVVYWALRLLRDSMLEEVLPTTIASPNFSAYDGRYDLRAVVMTDRERGRYSVWAINRAAQTLITRLDIPAIKNRTLTGNNKFLSDGNPRANNYLDGGRVIPKEQPVELKFDQSGGVDISLPPHSVTVLSFSLS